MSKDIHSSISSPLGEVGRGRCSLGFGTFSDFRTVHMGFAMIIIVLFHVALPRSSEWFGLRRMGNIGVDIFLFLSGMGLWYSWTKQRLAGVKDGIEQAKTSFLSDWKTFYVRRLKRVYPTWIVIACLYYIPRYSHGLDFGYQHGLIDLAGDVLVNWDFWLHDELTFWYVPAIMMLYIFAAPYMELIMRHSICRWLVVCMIAWTVSVQWVAPIHHAVGHIEIFWSRVPIFFLGINMGAIIKKQESLDTAAPWLALCVFLFTFVPSVYMEQHLHGRFPLFLERLVYIPMTVSGLFLLGELWKRTPKRVLQVLAYIGGLSLEIYLIHSHFVLWRIEKLHLGYWLTFVCTMVISVMLAQILNIIMQKILKSIDKR